MHNNFEYFTLVRCGLAALLLSINPKQKTCKGQTLTERIFRRYQVDQMLQDRHIKLQEMTRRYFEYGKNQREKGNGVKEFEKCIFKILRFMILYFITLT